MGMTFSRIGLVFLGLWVLGIVGRTFDMNLPDLIVDGCLVTGLIFLFIGGVVRRVGVSKKQAAQK